MQIWQPSSASLQHLTKKYNYVTLIIFWTLPSAIRKMISLCFSLFKRRCNSSPLNQKQMETQQHISRIDALRITSLLTRLSLWLLNSHFVSVRVSGRARSVGGPMMHHVGVSVSPIGFILRSPTHPAWLCPPGPHLSYTQTKDERNKDNVRGKRRRRLSSLVHLSVSRLLSCPIFTLEVSTELRKKNLYSCINFILCKFDPTRKTYWITSHKQ